MAKFMIAAFGLIAFINLIEALPAPDLFGLSNILGNVESGVDGNFGLISASRVDAGVNLTNGIDVHVGASASMEAAASALIEAEAALNASSSFQAGRRGEGNYIDAAKAMDAAESFLLQAELNITAAIALSGRVKANMNDGISTDGAFAAGLQTTALAIARAQASLKAAAALNVGLDFFGFSQFVGNLNAKAYIDAAIRAVGEARISLAAAAGIKGGIGIGGERIIYLNIEGQGNANVSGAADARIETTVR